MKKIVLFRPSRGSASYNRSRYLLYDQFTTDRAAGAVNTSLAEPVGGARTVTDANGKITISGGALNFATGGVANDWVYWAGQTHIAGRTFIADFGTRGANTSMTFGFDLNSVATTIRNGITFGQTAISYVSAAAAVVMPSITNTPLSLAIVMRTTAGYFYFIKGGGYTTWTLLNYSSVDTGAPEIPEIQTTNTTSAVAIDNARMSKRTINIIPIEADGFSAITTDGIVSPEGTVAPVGNAYADIGTWGVSGGAASCSTLSGSIGIRTLTTTSPDVIIEATPTRTAGVCGVVARYEDANNYLIAYHDGTNFKIDKVVAGVTSSLSSQARTYGAGNPIKLSVHGTSAIGQYNGLASAGLSVPASTATKHGLYTTDTGNTFNTLAVWARGTEGQYSGIDAL